MMLWGTMPTDPAGKVGRLRLFTYVSVANILQISFFTGQLKPSDPLLPGSHRALVSETIFQTMQATLNVRSRKPGPQRIAPVPAGRCPAMFGTSRWAE